MIRQDAARILGLKGEINTQDIKRAYRAAAMKYHPDRNPAGGEMMKVINEAFEALEDFCGDILEAEGEQNYPEVLNDALNIVINLEGLMIEICGAWVWVSGDTFTHKKTLKNAGFKFAPKKKHWYFRPDEWISSSRGSYSMEDIRGMHGSSSVSRPSQQKIVA